MARNGNLPHLHVQTRVRPDHRIEIAAPGLDVGQAVDVSVAVPEAVPNKKCQSVGDSVLDIINRLPANLVGTRETVDAYLRSERDSWDH